MRCILEVAILLVKGRESDENVCQTEEKPIQKSCLNRLRSCSRLLKDSNETFVLTETMLSR